MACNVWSLEWSKEFDWLQLYPLLGRFFWTLCKKCEKSNYAFGKGRGGKNIKVNVVHEHLNYQTHKEVAWVKKKGWKTLIKGIRQVNKYVNECVLNFMKVTYLEHD